MVANTGTYLDAPFHRYAEGGDLAELPLPSLADLPGIVVRRPWENGIAVDAAAFEGLRRRAARRCWSTPAGTGTGGPMRYCDDHPFLTAAAARLARRAWRGAGRDRQQQYRRHARARAAGAHQAARRRHPDLRAYDRARPASRRGFPLLRGAAEGARHGNLPGARLRRARLSERALPASRG